MFSTSVRVDVHDRTIMGFTEPGGTVWRYVNEIGRETAVLAASLAPKRTGRLAASVKAHRADTNAPYFATVKVSADAPYARFVHEGTERIFPRSSPYLRISPPYKGNPVIYAWVRRKPSATARRFVTDGIHVYSPAGVSGQASQPFLQQAMASVLASRGLF